jgi:hypothetical protein
VDRRAQTHPKETSVERSNGTLPRKGGHRGERTNEAPRYGRHVDGVANHGAPSACFSGAQQRGSNLARWYGDERGWSGIDDDGIYRHL